MKSSKRHGFVPYSAEFFYINQENGHYKYSFSAGIDYRRQNLTSIVDVGFWRLKSITIC